VLNPDFRVSATVSSAHGTNATMSTRRWVLVKANLEEKN
jgi:hypothetical protein